MFAMLDQIGASDLLRIAAGAILVLALVVVVLVRILKAGSRRNRRGDDSPNS
jgi:hypothetical protein